jgi:hypothetical protein
MNKKHIIIASVLVGITFVTAQAQALTTEERTKKIGECTMKGRNNGGSEETQQAVKGQVFARKWITTNSRPNWNKDRWQNSKIDARLDDKKTKIQTSATLLKEKMPEKALQIDQKVEERTERIEDRADDRKDQLEEKKVRIEDRLEKKLVNITVRRAAILSATWNRLDKLATRIDSRIEKNTAINVDTSTAKGYVAEARLALTAAQETLKSVSIESAKADIIVAFESTKMNLKKAHTKLNEAVQSLKTAKSAITTETKTDTKTAE